MAGLAALAAGASVAGIIPGGGGQGAIAAPVPYPLGPGYFLNAGDGGIFNYGDAQFFQSLGNTPLAQPMVDIAATPFFEGYWQLARDGGVFAFGSAGFHGSVPANGQTITAPAKAIAAHISGFGYYILTENGQVLAYGQAALQRDFGGSTDRLGQPFNAPMVGIATTPTGLGYWIVARDGGVFAYGDAAFWGSTGGMALNQPIVGIAATPTGKGYWLVARDGGVFAFGDAKFSGSTGAMRLNQPILDMAPTADGTGYWLAASDGGVFAFNAPFLGSAGALPLNQPVVGIAARPPLALAAVPFADAAGRTSGWVNNFGDESLVLTHDGTTTTPAGARVFGPEGLSVGQLGTVGFSISSGTCTAAGGNVRMIINADTNHDHNFDTRNIITCVGGPQTVSANPTTQGSNPLPSGAGVTSIEVVWDGAGTVNVDNITAAGIVVGDHLTHTSANIAVGGSQPDN